MSVFKSTIYFLPTHLASHWASHGIALLNGSAVFTRGRPLCKVAELLEPDPYFTFTMEKIAVKRTRGLMAYIAPLYHFVQCP